MKVVRKQAKIFAVFFVVLLGLVLLMLRGQNGAVSCANQVYNIDPNQMNDSGGADFKCKPSEAFIISFPEETLPSGKKTYWKMIDGGCELKKISDMDTNLSRTVYACTYPENGPMVITVQRALIERRTLMNKDDPGNIKIFEILQAD